MPDQLTPYAQLRTAQRQRFADVLPLPHPWAIYVEPTNVCNFRCRFCPESFEDYAETVGGHRRLSLQLYRKLLDDIADLGQLKALRFYMLGEPLVHPELPEMIRLAAARGVADRTELTTNATLLTEQKARALVESGLTYLRVSIYGVDKERHAHVTQSKIPVERIRDNVARFRAIRDEAGTPLPRLYVKIIDTRTDENERFRAMYEGVADEIEIESPMNWNDYDQRDLLAGVYGEAVPDAADSNPVSMQRKQICPFPFYTLVVHSNGDVSVCCVDWNKRTVVGNVGDSTLREIRYGTALREFQRMHIELRRAENDACRHCTYLHTSPDSLDGLSQERYSEILRERVPRRPPVAPER